MADILTQTMIGATIEVHRNLEYVTSVVSVAITL